ncbi:MAG: hypothetical protein L3J98_13135 [Gammaproteobacteria bacterium]|nr:hypothetical protein [Gammaproteobacteria bacterium]MCF6261082.1 hypothetical protein [Gammaproteobacteria bacterium]
MKLSGWLILSSIILLSACSGGGSDSNTNAITFSSSSIFNNTVRAVALAENSDDIYVVGDFTSYNGTASNRIIRINSDGSIDTGFDVGSGFSHISVRSIVAANDGSGDVYVGGSFTTYNGIPSRHIIRLNSDGSIDAGFDVGTGFDSDVYTITTANDGSGDIYVGGTFLSYRGNSREAIVRINSDGSNDASFDVGSGFNSTVRSIVVARDGSGDIYVGGNFTLYRDNSSAKIVRINSDSTFDTSFSVGTGFDKEVYSITTANDGSGDIYVGGNFTLYRGNSRVGIARINSDGSNDASFDVGAGFNAVVRSIVAASDGSGDIYVGGGFSKYNGEAHLSIACLESTGLVCVNFDSGTGFTRQTIVYVIVLIKDGSGEIYAGGDVRQYNGTDIGRLVRLGSSGQLK